SLDQYRRDSSRLTFPGVLLLILWVDSCDHSPSRLNCCSRFQPSHVRQATVPAIGGEKAFRGKDEWRPQLGATVHVNPVAAGHDTDDDVVFAIQPYDFPYHLGVRPKTTLPQSVTQNDDSAATGLVF